MANRPAQAALSEAITRFEDEVREFAFGVVRSIVLQEIERRLEELRASLAPERARRVAKAAKAKRAPERVKPERIADSIPSIEIAVAKPTPDKRGWTRDMIVSELATCW